MSSTFIDGETEAQTILVTFPGSQSCVGQGLNVNLELRLWSLSAMSPIPILPNLMPEAGLNKNTAGGDQAVTSVLKT